MAHTYEPLKGKTIAELRDIAKDVTHDAVRSNHQIRSHVQ